VDLVAGSKFQVSSPLSSIYGSIAASDMDCLAPPPSDRITKSFNRRRCRPKSSGPSRVYVDVTASGYSFREFEMPRRFNEPGVPSAEKLHASTGSINVLLRLVQALRLRRQRGYDAPPQRRREKRRKICRERVYQRACAASFASHLTSFSERALGRPTRGCHVIGSIVRSSPAYRRCP